MWLVSVLRDQTLDFRSCAFANTPKNPAGMKKPGKIYILRNIFILIQLAVDFTVSNALITELGELWKAGSTF